MTTFDTITPVTLCPSALGGLVRHYPQFAGGAVVTLPGIGVRPLGSERTVMLAVCGDAHLVPPCDEPDESDDVVLCGGCARARYGRARLAPGAAPAAEPTSHHRPMLRIVSG